MGTPIHRVSVSADKLALISLQFSNKASDSARRNAPDSADQKLSFEVVCTLSHRPLAVRSQKRQAGSKDSQNHLISLAQEDNDTPITLDGRLVEVELGMKVIPTTTKLVHLDSVCV